MSSILKGVFTVSYLIEATNNKVRPAAVIANNLGISIAFASRNSDILDGCKGMTCVQNGKIYIFIADDLQIAEQRLTLTHELSHIYLGHLLGLTDEQFNVSGNQAEFEAESLGFILYNFLYGIDGGRK